MERVFCCMTTGTLQKALDTVHSLAYIINVKTFTILFANKKAHRLIQNTPADEPCYTRLFHRDSPCAACPAPRRQEFRNAQYAFELFDTDSQCWNNGNAFFFLSESAENKEVCFLTLEPRQPLTERELRLESLAYTDEVTAITNNRGFEEHGPTHIARAAREGRSLAVLALKFDGLHHINSNFGYAQGDAILRKLARSIRESLPVEALFARRRGNDFSIVSPLNGHDIAEELNTLISKLRYASRTVHEDQSGRWFHLNIGVSLYPEHGNAFEVLNRKARQAMPSSQNGENFSFACYDHALMTSLRDKETLLLDLRIALRRKEMHLLFQPKFDLRQNRIGGAEALIRWHHPARGLIRPDLFIALAEENLFIHAIDNWVINESCRLWKEVLERSPIRIPLSINISPQKFYQDDMLDRLTKAVKRYGLLPDDIEVELTERTALEDIDRAVSIMNRMRKKGFRVAIDDFGTGYSSLNYLQELPFDVVKLDRSFVVNTRPKSQAILRSLVDMIKIYGAQIVFEGVETQEQFNFAIDAGCDIVQGFYKGAPADKESLIQSLIHPEQPPSSSEAVRSVQTHAPCNRLF